MDNPTLSAERLAELNLRCRLYSANPACNDLPGKHLKEGELDALLASHAALAQQAEQGGDGKDARLEGERDALKEALGDCFVMTTSGGDPDPTKRKAVFSIEWRGEGSLQRFHAFYDAFRAFIAGEG